MKTAVDYIVGMANELGYIPSEFYDKAKELERLQIIEAHGLKYYDIGEVTITGEQYYNETYNENK